MGKYFNENKDGFNKVSVYDEIKNKMYSKDEDIILTITEREFLYAFDWIKTTVDNVRMDNKYMPYCGDKYLDEKKKYGEKSLKEKWTELENVGGVVDASSIKNVVFQNQRNYFRDKGQINFKHLGEKTESSKGVYYIGRNLSDEKLKETKAQHYPEARDYDDSYNQEEDTKDGF